MTSYPVGRGENGEPTELFFVGSILGGIIPPIFAWMAVGSLEVVLGALVLGMVVGTFVAGCAIDIVNWEGM